MYRHVRQKEVALPAMQEERRRHYQVRMLTIGYSFKAAEILDHVELTLLDLIPCEAL